MKATLQPGRGAPIDKAEAFRFDAMRKAFGAGRPEAVVSSLELHFSLTVQEDIAGDRALGKRIGESGALCEPSCGYALSAFSGLGTAEDLAYEVVVRQYLDFYSGEWPLDEWFARFEHRPMYRVVADKVLVADLTHRALAELGVTVPGLAAAGAALTSHDAEAWEAVRSTIDRHPGVVALRLSTPGPLDDLAVCQRALHAGAVRVERRGDLLDHVPPVDWNLPGPKEMSGD